MKTFGIWIMAIAVLLAVIGAMSYPYPASQSSGDSALLRASQMLVDSCRNQQNLDQYLDTRTDCSAYERTLAERQERLAIKTSGSLVISLSLIGAFPFIFLIGVILFAAGKVEQTVLAMGTAAPTETTQPKPLSPPPSDDPLRMTPEEAAEWTKRNAT